MRIVIKSQSGLLMPSKFASTALALILMSPVPALADEAADAAEIERQTIIVTGQLDGYRAIDSTSGTKTNTPLLDVPQSISVVTAQQVQDLQIRSVADLVHFIPGVSSGQGEGHRDQITLRGNNTTADFFVNGLRDDVQYFRSFYNVERIEALKGSNAMIFGRGGGGGVINRVTKVAQIDNNRYQGTVSADTFGSYYVAGDLNGSLGKVAVRINGFYEDLNNHRDAFGGERYAVNPTLAAEIGTSTRIDLGYEYIRDDRVVDRGIPSAFPGSVINPAGPLRGFRDAFFGQRGVNDTDFEASLFNARFESRITDNLTFTATGLYGDYDKVYANVFAATAVITNATIGARTFGAEAYIDPTTRKNYIGQANLEWRVSTGPIDHVILIGGEYTRQDSTNARTNGFPNPAVIGTAASRRATGIPLISKPVLPTFFFIPGAAGNDNRNFTSDLDQISVYAQDQISFGEKVDLIAGLRYDRFDNKVTNLFASPAPLAATRVDDLWSPRVGLVYKPVPAASLYVSYSRSFLPQSGDQFLSFNATAATLKPERFDNYEVGAKWDILPKLTLTTAVFRLDRENTRAPGPVAGQIVQTGSQRSSGFELSLVGNIIPKLTTSFGYAYTNAKITSTTTAAPNGRRVGQVPRNQLSLFNRYEVTDRLGIGATLYYQSAQFATISNATRLPAYTRIDGAIYYKLTDKIEAQVNIENLTDKTYFPTAHNDNNISTGAPLNARFTLIAKF
jgi:catecholate siderophore receptor